MHFYAPIVYLTSLLIPWLIYIFGAINYYSDYMSTQFASEDASANTVYDFIVVGSGAAGAVVARRLATSKDVKVLLLEAGGDPSPLNSVLGIAIDLLGYPETDWMMKTVPQKHACWGLENNKSFWNAGKVLGGSTTLNYQFYLRGHPNDYNNWAKLTGDNDWAYENLIPFFKKSIKTYNGGFSDNKKHYSESEYGFLNIATRSWLNLHEEFLEAGRERGYPTIDVNGGGQRTGCGIIESTQKNGKRYGTYASVILDLEQRPNIKISKFSQAIKVKLDKNLNAVGVWYVHHGVKKFARASKEVILSSGSVNSPKLLMLSGIGIQSHLKSVGIKPKLNLPVGENLKDHIVIPILPFIINESLSFLPDRDFSPKLLYDFQANGKGPLTVPNAIHSQMFYTSKIARKDENGTDWPDVQNFLSVAGIFQLLDYSLYRGTKIRPEIFSPLLTPYIGQDGFVLLAGLVRPKSKGDVKLRSKDPFATPLIDPRYLEVPDDVKALVDGIQQLIKMVETTDPFKRLGTYLPKTKLQGCEQHEFQSDNYWECYVRHFTLTIWHPVGTCRMGRRQDKTAVVDTQLRVIGAKGLRVVDGSIMPEIVNANTMAPSIMIGEKGAQYIREYWSQHFLVSDLRNHLFFKDLKICYYAKLI